MTPIRIRRLLLALGLGWSGLGAVAQSPSAPDAKALKFVVPFPPGSGTDTSARYYARKVSELTGQAVVVENKPGANGFIAVRAVLSAPADGTTVFVGSNSTLAVNAALFKQLPYENIQHTDSNDLVSSLWMNAIILPQKGSVRLFLN